MSPTVAKEACWELLAEKKGQELDNDASSGSLCFLFFTEKANGEDEVFNRVYKYELRNGELINSELILDLPGTPGSRHNGGETILGLDGNICAVIGSVNDDINEASNVDSAKPNGTCTENGDASYD